MNETKIVKSRTKAGGRTKGTPNKKTKDLQEKVAASGLTPVEFLLQEMRNVLNDKATRIDAAKAVAPYIHAKLASIEYTGKDGGPIEVTQITRRIVRS